MSSPKDDTTEFNSNSDANENHLTSSDAKSSAEKRKAPSRNLDEDSRHQEKYVTNETATKKNENNGDESVGEFEVISNPECQAGEPVVDSELENVNLQKKVTEKVQIVEKENADYYVAYEHQYDDSLNASAFEGNTSEYLECDGESLSDEDEILSYDTTTLDVTVGKISENVLQVFEERSLLKEKEAVSQSTHVSGKLVDEQSKVFEAGSHTPSAQNAKTSTEDSAEVIVGNGDRNFLVDENNKDFSTGSRMPEIQNAITSTEGSLEVADESEDKNLNSFVDERNKDSSFGSTMPHVKNAATSTEVSVDEDSSANERKLSAKSSLGSPEEVTEMISKHLNSKEYIKKLDKIDEIVKQLTSEEFLSAELSTEDLSPEDLETLKKIYSQQLEKMATKRKSKLCELDEEPEDLQAISKKCKLSSGLDRPFKLENWETSCCLEEQFRIAFKETSDDQGGNSQKEYSFPLTSGSEQQRKFCKHQIAKIDAMVASAMSLDNYMSQLPDDTGNSTEEIYEDTPCCYHTKAQSSSGGRKILSGPQKSVPEKMIADSNQERSETSDKTKWYGYFMFEGTLNSIKNFILFVSFTGSLMVAMTVGKVFGVDFPVGKSKRNNERDNSSQEFPTVNA